MRLRDHEGVTKSDMFAVDPRQLRVDPSFNVRDFGTAEAQDGLARLKESIRLRGVEVPLEIRIEGADLYVVSGHRRLRCVMELIAEGVEIASIPCVAEPKTINAAERTARLISLNEGMALTPLEKAEVVRRLLQFGWDRTKIAERIGAKTLNTIANLETLLAAPEPIRDAVRAGEMSATEAVTMVRAEGDAAAERLPAMRQRATEQGKRRLTAASGTRDNVPRKPRAPTPVPDNLRSHAAEDAEQATLEKSAITLQPEPGAIRLAISTLLRAEQFPAAELAASFAAITPASLENLADWLLDLAQAIGQANATTQVH